MTQERDRAEPGSRHLLSAGGRDSYPTRQDSSQQDRTLHNHSSEMVPRGARPNTRTICGFHGGGYEKYRLLGCDAPLVCKRRTLRRNVPPLSTGRQE
jgi:hypothetical protein